MAKPAKLAQKSDTPTHLRAQAAEPECRAMPGIEPALHQIGCEHYTLPQRLLDCADALDSEAVPAYTVKTMVESAAEISRLTARVSLLEGALKEMTEIWGKCWDREDGGLSIMARNVPRFDEANRLARIVLGCPLFGDNGEDHDA